MVLFIIIYLSELHSFIAQASLTIYKKGEKIYSCTYFLSNMLAIILDFFYEKEGHFHNVRFISEGVKFKEFYYEYEKELDLYNGQIKIPGRKKEMGIHLLQERIAYAELDKLLQKGEIKPLRSQIDKDIYINDPDGNPSFLSSGLFPIGVARPEHFISIEYLAKYAHEAPIVIGDYAENTYS